MNILHCGLAILVLSVASVSCRGPEDESTPHPGEDCLTPDSDPPICNLWVNPDTREPVFITHDYNCSRFWMCGPDMEYCLFECAPLPPGFEPDTNLYFDYRIQYPNGPVCVWPSEIDCKMQNNTCSSVNCPLYPCNTCKNGACTKYECCKDEDCLDDGKPNCNNHVCTGCIGHEDCDGYNNVCDDSYSNCQWCDNPNGGDGGACHPGCVDDDNCDAGETCTEDHKCERGCENSECCDNSDCSGCNTCNDDFTCTKFDCCDNSDCKLECDLCLLENHVCTTYECCVDDDCQMGEVCDNHVCKEGCRKDEDCWENGKPEICNVIANYENCHYCNITDGATGVGECKPGCSFEANPENCPEELPVCVNGHVCGASGDKILYGIYITTESCQGCAGTPVEDGVMITLEKLSIDLSCDTNNMDHKNLIDYAPKNEAAFEAKNPVNPDDLESLGDCFKRSWPADIDAGTLTWTGAGTWTPAQGRICYQYKDNNYLWACKLNQPTLSQGQSTTLDCGSLCS